MDPLTLTNQRTIGKRSQSIGRPRREEEGKKKSLCGNCVAFDISPRMKECMPGDTFDDDGELGYCWMHHFKCHSARACHTWAKGGPIKSNKESAEWQKKNSGGMDE